MELSIIRDGTGVFPVLLDEQMRIIKPVFEFLRFQRARGLAENTLRSYGWDLKRYFEFLSTQNIHYDAVSFSMIGDFVEFLRSPANATGTSFLYTESKRTAKTINRILGTVHSFYKYQAMMGGIDNPVLMQDIKKPSSMFKSMLEHTRKDNYIKQSVFKVKESDYAVNLMSDADAERFLGALSCERDKLIFKTMLLTGARIGEVLNLRIEDIPFPNGTRQLGVLRGIKSKGKKRDLYVPMSLIEEIDTFILEERSRIDTQHSYVFVALQGVNCGNPMTYRGIYEVFQRAARDIGIHLRCHDIRHTFITKLVESGMDISVVRIIAGHKHISTTQEYLHISTSYLEKALGQYWRQSSLIGGNGNVE